jgi:tripartite-type tricarboxylate transporter receptor subunit TctC
MALVLSGATSAVLAQGERYPSKPISFIVPFTPGGSSDLMARTLAPLLEQRLGGVVNVINRPGATATLATGQVARAQADGYTIIIDPVGVFTLQPLLREVPYKLDDFRGVSGLSIQEIVVAINAKSPYKSYKDLVDAARKEGRAIVYGSSGTVGFPHISQAALLKASGLKGRHIAFEGSAQAMTALLGGHIEMIAVHPPEVLPQIKAGSARALGVLSAKRLASLPDIPTFAEQGVDVGEFAVWNSVLMPKDVPDPVASRLGDAFQWALQQPKWRDTADQLGFTTYPIDGDQVMKRLRAEANAHGELVDSLGLRPSK